MRLNWLSALTWAARWPLVLRALLAIEVAVRVAFAVPQLLAASPRFVAFSAIVCGLGLGLVLTYALPVSADVTHEDGPRVFGDGVTVACDTTPATIDDTDVGNGQEWRWVICKNDSANTVRISFGNGTQGGAPTTTTPGTAAGEVWASKVPKNVTPKCYAASASNIQCSEAGALP